MSDLLQDREFLASTQYKTAANVNARWELYKHAVPLVDIHEHGIDALHLKGTEDILDVGCGTARTLVYLRSKGHKGRLVGVDISQELFCEDAKNEREKQLRIELSVCSADELFFSDNSFDVLLSYFMLYHMPDISQALSEWKRVLKKKGRLLVATQGADDRSKNKKMMSELADFLHAEKPGVFSAPFNMDNGLEQLSTYFKVAHCFIYDGELRLIDTEPYIRSVESIRHLFNPPPNDSAWEEGMNLLRKKVQSEITLNGYFFDFMKRGYFVCEKVS